MNELCCMLTRDLSFTDFQMCIFEWAIVSAGFLFYVVFVVMFVCLFLFVCLFVHSFFWW